MTTKENSSDKWSVKKVIAGIGIVLGIFVGGFTVGNCVPKVISPSIIGKSPVDSWLQFKEEYDQKEYVIKFRIYLKSIQDKKRGLAWSTMSEYMQTEYSSEKTLDNAFLLTNNYEIHQLIPIRENNSSASFYMYHTITDLVGPLDVLKSARNAKIIDANTIIDDQSLIDEIKTILTLHYEIDANKVSMLDQQIKSYLASMSMREFIHRSWMFVPIIGHKLELSIRKNSEVDNYFEKRPSLDAFSFVEMVKENGDWKVNQFKTIAIQRWGYND